MPSGPGTLLAALALCGCGAPTGRVVQEELGPGPRIGPPGGFAFMCVYVPPSGEEPPPPPPSAVLALCGATEQQVVQVTRIEVGLRVRLRFPDVPGRLLELYVYRTGEGYARGARVVARRRALEPEVFTPESGWLAVHYYDRRKRALAIHYALRYPGLVITGALREGDVPVPAAPPKRLRPDPWGVQDAGPSP